MRTAKPNRVNFKFLPKHRQALDNLSDLTGKTMTKVVEDLIERKAKREKVWPG